MQKIPYGVSNFASIIREGYYFVDRTAYIARKSKFHLYRDGSPPFIQTVCRYTSSFNPFLRL
jgi:hypothetical protein